jgi:hypothetical protein
VGKVIVDTGAVDVGLEAGEGAVGDLGLGLKPMVGKVFAESLLERSHGHGRILA